MKATGKQKKVRHDDIQKGLKEIDAFFSALKGDTTLPSFGEFFATCLIVGNAECVNLRLLYPKLFKKLSKWLEGQNRKIVVPQNKR